MKRQTFMKSTLCLLMALVCNVAWAQTFVEPAEGKYYKIKGTHSTNPWLTATVESGGIDVAANEADAAVYLKTANGLQAITTGQYIGTKNGQISLVDNEETVTIEAADNGRMYIKTGDRYLYNNQADYTREAGNLTAAGTDAPKWNFIEVDEADAIALSKTSALAHVEANKDFLGSNVGYCYYVVNGKTVTDPEGVKNAINSAETLDAIIAIKNSFATNLPKEGVAYKMAFKTKAGALHHFTVDGTSLSTSTDAGNASVFYCTKHGSGAYTYIFISADGKYLKFHTTEKTSNSPNTLTDNYTSELNNFKVEAMIDKTANIDSDKASRLGTVCIIADKRAAGNNTDGCYILKNSANPPTFDVSDAPYHKDGFTSAIVMTEVEGYDIDADANSAVKQAVINIAKTEAQADAKAHVTANASKLGEGIGYAYYMAGETKLYTADEVNAAIDEAATIEDVNAITNSFKYEVPKAGTPYYLFDAAHNVYVDIHNLGAESNYPAVNQMATLSSEQQPLYITANPADGSWKIHTTLRGGSYLCQYTGGKQTWDSWVSTDAADYSWSVEVSVDGENLYYLLKNTGSAGGYLGCDVHENGKVLYANQTDENKKLKLQLVEVTAVKPSVMVYRPTTRATTLTSGKKYMIYNTTFNGAEDRTGFLYDNGSGMGHSGAPKQKPATFKTVQDAYLWEIEATDEDGKYYLKAADGTYVNVSGNNGNAEPVALYIQPWNSSTATKAGVKSEAADGTMTENANIGADVFTISGTKQGHTGKDCWNGNPNTFAMWESAHPYAFYEVEATEKTFDEGFPIPGRTYYIYCDNDTRQYFYNDGGTLKVSEKRTEWSNEYLFTCLYDGEYFQFKNMKGKYLAHKTLSDNAHNFELASYLGGVNLKTPDGSYFVMKADGGFDQSSEGQYDPASTNFSTVYKFEEFNFPVDGEVYYIYSDTYQSGAYVNRYLYADGSSLKLNTSLSLGSAYQWTCKVTDDGKVQFQNGAGKYLAHKGIQDTPYNFTLNKYNANHAIAATLYSDAASRYFVVKNDGSEFNHSTGTYNQTNGDWCTDFVFMPINDVQVLTVNGSCWSDAQATWNGETKTLPASWAITPHTVISDATLSVTGSDNFTFTGLYDGTTSLGETTEIESLDGSLTLTAKLAPSFFSASTTEGDLIPVRIRNVRNNSYTLRLNANENYTGKAVNSGVTAYGENEIWYLVGTEQSFKIYNRVAGTGLHIVLEGTGENSAASMNTTTTNADFCLVTKDNGYAICPKSNTGQSFNMNGGAGKDIKLYRTSDGGSNWTIEKMDVNNTLTFSVSIEGETWEENRGAGAITITVNGIAGKKNIEDFAGEQKCYLPLNGTFTIASDTYRGYTFNGFVVNGTTVETLADQTLTEDLDVEASYTANEEKVLYYTPDANGKPYRIPAIAAAPNGHIFAIADNRPCGNDIGYGEVDIKCRISKDNGATWGEEFFIADGQGGDTNEMTTGYGDAAVVADRESNKLLVMMVCGKTVCHDGRWDKSKIGDTDAPAVNRVARIYLTYNEETGEWDKSEIVEMTDHIYSLFLNGETPTVTSMFIGSGKICQSRVVKKDKYYRLYCSMWTRDGGNRVIYSDDFGGTWNVLGTINDRPASGGDEPKVEELADGTVVLSSRKYHGRYFNLFTFSDNTYTTGTWGTVVSSNDVADGLAFGNNSTNGEIYKVTVMHKESKRICDLMFQSVPTGDGRNNVAIYYKELNANTYTPTTIAQGWTKGKHVSYKSSCYSTMIMQADGRIAFLFEEAPGGYCIVYIPYTIEDLTGGTYCYVKPIIKQDLYNTSKGDGVIPPYRIPGITTAKNGRLITAAARLVCGTDPGYGQVDVVCRYSDNHGDTWSPMIDVAVGTGRTSATENFFDTAFGDPAIVADRTSNEVLIIAVAGCTVYANGNTTRQNPNLIATIRSTDNGETWGEPVNVTEPIYSLFDSGNPIQSAFVGGGKIFQSRIVKVGKYYRLYAAMCARPNGNRVIYSDDFGRTWHALGGASALPAPGGDEPKCEELPDGRVVLSSRVGGGRIYNIYTYSNTETAEGSWGTDVKSTFEGSGLTPGGNSTNGEILIVPVQRNSDGKEMYLALQSLPTGGGRTNVGIFYKELTDMTDINTVANFAADWNGFFQVSNTSSAYSSMDLQADNRIGFIYEETLTGFGKRDNPVSTSFPTGEGQHNFDGFDNIYVAYPLEYITDGAYSIKRDVNRKEYLQTYFTALTEDIVEELKEPIANDIAALNAEPTIAEVDGIYFNIGKGDAIPAFDAHIGGKIGHYTDAAVTAYKAAVVAAETAEELTAAKNAVLTSDNWNKPVNGKAYTFKSVQKDGTTVRWYKYNATETRIDLTATESEATPFVCRLLDNGKYVFVCNDGKYMTWRASASNHTTSGVNDAYDMTNNKYYTDINISKMTTGGNITGNLSTTRYVSISASRDDRNETGFVVVKKNSGNPVFDGASDPFYNDNYSSAFIMEEAAFGNTPKVNSVGESGLMSEDLHNKHMSTFSATYATVAPEGVTAYYATKAGEKVALYAIDEKAAIPANTGVILVSEKDGNVVMLPAAGETAADVTGNLMVGTAGTAKVMDGIANAYLLTGGEQRDAGFYRCSGGTLAAGKAYLQLESTQQALRIRLADDATEIEMPVANGQQPTAIYDLTGRRVEKMEKGIYIVNGRKVVIK